jgi:hypothetical protein
MDRKVARRNQTFNKTEQSLYEHFGEMQLRYMKARVVTE